MSGKYSCPRGGHYLEQPGCPRSPADSGSWEEQLQGATWVARLLTGRCTSDNDTVFIEGRKIMT